MIERTLALALCAAVGTAASAHPLGDAWPTKPAAGPVGGVDSSQALDEDFEAYSVGEGVTTMGGWELWPAGLDATVSDDFAASGTKSGNWSLTGIDVVHQFSGLDSGQVTWSTMTYVPSGSNASYYMIALNRYDGGATTTGTLWSIQVQFNTLLGELLPDCAGCGGFATMVYDEWVEFRAEIDFDTDTYDLYYDGEIFVEDVCWTCGVFGTDAGDLNFAAIDLFTQTSTTPMDIYLDDVLVEEDGGCYADCDGSGSLDFFDFLCFQNAFAAGDPYADCDSSGSHDFFDFLCFQNAFAAGCP